MIADGGPSTTARRVAAHRLGFERIPAGYGDPAADDALTAEIAGGLTVPDGRMHDYLAIRTAFFDHVVVRAIDAGARQIVNGGAGYDGRSLRYAAPGVRWFEIDHPATQRDKLATLRRLDLAVGGIRFVAADFTGDPVAGLLVAAGLEAGVPSLFLLEGVAVYLEAAVLETLLGQFRDVTGPDSRLAISMPMTGTQRAGSRFRATVAAMGEPALSRFDPDQAEDLLARAGWRIEVSAGPDPDGRRGRLLSAGLLVAQAVPRSHPASRSRSGPRPAPRTGIHAEGPPLSLTALLSQALVAFTIEADNEAEHRIPHRTTGHGAAAGGGVGGPWLVSLAMYENCLRYLDDDEPLTVGELRHRARTGTNLDGMRRWGYVTLTAPGTPAASTGRLKNPGPGTVIRATDAGRLARDAWARLPGVIEGRWRDRYGAAEVDELRDALRSVVRQLDQNLPDTLPILGHGLFGRTIDPPPPPSGQPVSTLTLNALLSRVLLSIALEFERESAVSLATSANVLRVLTADGTLVRDLPRLTGVSKESISMAMTALRPAGLVVTGKESGGRWQTARLTPDGVAAKRVHQEHLTACEAATGQRHPDAIHAVLRVLEPLARAAGNAPPPLFAGLDPYPDGWRAAIRRPAVLPHYPMVLHRGGYPDGS